VTDTSQGVSLMIVRAAKYLLLWSIAVVAMFAGVRSASASLVVGSVVDMADLWDISASGGYAPTGHTPQCARTASDDNMNMAPQAVTSGGANAPVAVLTTSDSIINVAVSWYRPFDLPVEPRITVSKWFRPPRSIA
jgi:hypothetical protein